ncbi:site-specific DNA-methyltransferase [Arthrobacter sp. LS16]|uniref:site-specific DNA-methyltransferase n=1 Tax=Arthrobacter sp. 'calajunan' TaxID=1690248 RepID=UPI003C71E67B
MSRLTDLLRQVRGVDAQLGADLEKEIVALTKRRSFGLVFERHQPEAVELPHQPIRRGAKVRVLPPRNEVKKGDQRLWRVESLELDGVGKRNAQLIDLTHDEPERINVAVEDLVVVAEFEDKIYPGLIKTGCIERGGDKPFHTVINAENFHALEMLTYTHRGRIDAIYVDPPYNTGARDWKYNNDYVEGDDDYRHSKWLALIERRLLVARELLNPEDSVLIVTIDEKEYLRLGLLLEQTFPDAQIQMISSVINSKGSARSNAFSRTDEYIFVVQIGKSSPKALPLGEEWRIVNDKRAQKLQWAWLARQGAGGLRTARPNLFYPIFATNGDAGPEFVAVGDAYFGDDYHSVQTPDGAVAIWPIRGTGEEGRWSTSPSALRELIAAGHAKLGKWRDEQTAVMYLNSGQRKKIADGVFPVIGRASDNSVIVNDSGYVPEFVAGTQWRISSHNSSGSGGAGMLSALLPGRRFPYPKSLYAVEDILRFYVQDKPNAIVLDFFSGSGTTAHAVMRLNHEDGGVRQCISVTNNEVSAEEQIVLRKRGLRPGDDEWENHGICDFITKPRLRAAISGITPEGDRVKGDYKFNAEFSLAEGLRENAAFFTLTYETPLSVRRNRSFERIAPMLWMRAGSRGRILSELGVRGWELSDVYAVIENVDNSNDFIDAIRGNDSVQFVFVITDDDAVFQMICREIPEDVHVIRLYESYFQNFEINQGRSL